MEELQTTESNMHATEPLVEESLPVEQTVVPTVSHGKKLLVIWMLLTICLSLGVGIYFVRLQYLLAQNTATATPAPQPEQENLPSPPTINPEVSLQNDVNNTELYFVRDDVMYKLSPLHAEPTAYLPKVQSYAFSPDHTKLAYIPGYGDGEDNDVRIRTIKDGKEVRISTGRDSTSRGLEWSPAGSYLLIDAGTGPEGSYAVYDAATAKYLSNFGDGNHRWRDEKTIFMSQRVTVDPPRPWGAGEGVSISKINVTTGTSTILLASDATTDYSIQGNDDKCVYYWRDKVTDQTSWGDSSKTERTYYCLDQTTDTSTLLTSDGYTHDEKAKDALKLATSEAVAYPSFTYNKTYPDWVIASLYNSGSIFSTQIVMFNITDPKATYRVLSKGAYVTWY